MDLTVIRSADGRWKVLSVLHGDVHTFRIMQGDAVFREVASLAEVRRVLLGEVGLAVETLHCAPSARLDR